MRKFDKKYATCFMDLSFSLLDPSGSRSFQFVCWFCGNLLFHFNATAKEFNNYPKGKVYMLEITFIPLLSISMLKILTWLLFRNVSSCIS